MSEKLLHIGRGFSLPAEQVVEAKFGIIGQSGRGKTGLIRRTLEECHRVGLPFVALDPSGILWGLRSSYDGKSPGIPVLVIGGEHGDLKLERTAGAEVARAIVAANVSCVVDLGSETKGVYRQFARDFAEALFAANDTPRLLVLDEAPELVPQSLVGRPDLAATFDAVERLVRQGRNKGLGVMLASQRAATISKDVLTQCGSLFVFGLVGTPDRKSLREWVGAFGDKEHLDEFEEGLASLERRECWFWSPSEFKEFRKLHVLDFHTYHPDKTHLRRLGLLEQKPVTTDVSAVVQKLGVVVAHLREEKATATETPRLKREIERLTRELAGEKSKLPHPAADPKAIERAVAERDRWWGEQMKLVARGSRTASARLEEAKAAIGSALAALPATVDGPPPVPHPPAPPVLAVTSLAPRANYEPRLGDDPTKPLMAGERLMLREIISAADEGKQIDRRRLGALVGMASRGGGFRNYVGHIKREGLVTEDEAGFHPTPDGRVLLGPITDAPSTPRERIAKFQQQLMAGERAMLDKLIESGGEGLTREQLGESVGMAWTGGGFRNYVGHLKRLGCVAETHDGLHAAPELLA